MRFTDNIARTLAAAAAMFLIAACGSPSDTSRITSVETSIILPAPTSSARPSRAIRWHSMGARIPARQTTRREYLH